VFGKTLFPPAISMDELNGAIANCEQASGPIFKGLIASIVVSYTSNLSEN
jgi:hypothetical protein